MFRAINEGFAAIVGLITLVVGVNAAILGAPLGGALLAAAGLMWHPRFRRSVAAPPRTLAALVFLVGLAVLPPA